MARLEKLERDSRDFKRALVQITDILIDQSERIDALGKNLGGRIDALGGRLDEQDSEDPARGDVSLVLGADFAVGYLAEHGTDGPASADDDRKAVFIYPICPGARRRLLVVASSFVGSRDLMAELGLPETSSLLMCACSIS